ncbi:hypothetical protein LSH36_12g29024 [Paralvinella palmiformis]|uniref:Uncharacterized protein n=1 Tax=Paralvinella palmiformis TaxID=53620 RepID=A0AAD9KDD8_9ANNE|nr:hypothetical protein LSH36_12g29024 [Paralvinella palmiformis]
MSRGASALPEVGELVTVSSTSIASDWRPCCIICFHSQSPRACSSLLTSNSSLPGAPYMTNGNVNKNSHQYDHQNGTYSHNGTNGQLRNIPTTQREIEIQHLLELLKRDQDSSSLTSGEGSNTDSGRGGSEEGDLAGPKSTSQSTDVHGSVVAHTRLAPVLEDSYSSNQVVPGSFCESSMSYLSLHNTTVGSYLPSEQIRAASRNSQQSQQRPLSAASNTVRAPSKPDSVIVDMIQNDSRVDNAFYGLETRSPTLKSILKPIGKLSDSQQATPLAQQGIDNYIKSRLGGGGCKPCSGSAISEMESEMCNTDMKYSCTDMSDVLHSKTAHDVSEFLDGSETTTTSPTVDDDDDDADGSSTTSGSYVVDPKELCEEIDQLFFNNLS